MSHAMFAELAPDRRPGLLASWLAVYERSPLRLPGRIDREALHRLLGPILDGFAEAADGGPLPPPGSPQLRELEKSIGFLGAQLAVTGASGFDVVGLVV